MRRFKFAWNWPDFVSWLSGGYRRVHWWHAWVILLLIVIISFIARWVGLSVAFFNPIGEAFGDLHFSDGFFYSHNLGEKIGEPVPDLVIVDLSGLQSREEIAARLAEVAACHPAAVGLDVIFASASSVDRSADDSLSRVLARMKDRLVIAANRSAPMPEYSFFADDGYREGDVRLPDGVIRSFIPSKGSFAAEVLSVAGYPDIYSDQERLIDFKKADIYSYDPLEPLTAAGIQGKIVLVGDIGDLRDSHRAAVPINGKTRVSGVELFAQELFTLTCGTLYRQPSRWLEIVLAVVLVYLFLVFFVCRIFDYGKPFNGLLVGFWQLICIVILFFADWLLFFLAGIWLPPGTALIGLGFAGLAGELFYWFKSHCK